MDYFSVIVEIMFRICVIKSPGCCRSIRIRNVLDETKCSKFAQDKSGLCIDRSGTEMNDQSE